MTKIRRYPAKRSKRGYKWEVAYPKPDGKWTRKRGFETQRDAQLWAEQNGSNVQAGTYIAPADGRLTVEELGKQWLSRQSHWKPSYRRTQESTWHIHVLPTWGPTKIKDIRKSQVETWAAQLSSTHSPSTVLRAIGILGCILDTAVEDRLIAVNPARQLRNLPRKKTRSDHAYLTHAQVEALANASGSWATLIYLACYTGLRWGELAGLRVKHLQFDKKRVLVRENAVEVGSKIIVGTPKGHENRDVPLPEFLVEKLMLHCEGKSPDDLVFTAPRVGGHIRRPKSGRSWFASAVKAARIEGAFTPHDMRHTTASLAVQAGANVKVIQRMLGHESAALTLDTYADLFDDDLDSVAVALDTARSRFA